MFVGVPLFYIARQARQVPSDEEIMNFAALAAWAEPRLAIAGGDFKIRRALTEAFSWRFMLVWRGEQRIVVVRWASLRVRPGGQLRMMAIPR
jgi:hypothetical protein